MRKSIGVEELKKIEIGLLDELADYCSSQGLRYFLTYGTLLGAVRHEGFIPWDDDIDVIMPRQDYEAFISNYNKDRKESSAKVLSHKLDKNYYLPIAKLIDKRTVLKEQTAADYELGVYIDIFPMDNLSNDYNCAKKQLKKVFALNRQWMIKTITINRHRNGLKNLALRIGKIALHKRDTYEILNDMDSYFAANYSYSYTKYVGITCGIFIGNETRIFRSEWFDKTTLLQFEGKKYPAPEGYDALLHQLYGDYMQLPPPSQRVSHHVFKAWYK